MSGYCFFYLGELTMEQIKFTKEFWSEWVKNPQETAQKHGLDWSKADPKWKNWSRDQWANLSWQEGQELLKNSKWSGWFWWE